MVGAVVDALHSTKILTINSPNRADHQAGLALSSALQSGTVLEQQRRDMPALFCGVASIQFFPLL